MFISSKFVFWVVSMWPLLFTTLIGQSVAQDDKDPILNYASLDKPFRMQKCNVVWDKARTKPLQESKLKLLYYELKLQDKEEIALKKLKAEMGDKNGLREAEVRKKFNGIMNAYGLTKQNSQDKMDTLPNHRIFKDKKLDRLWEKAQVAGLEEDELMLLKKEFQHHQEKVDEYHRLKEMAETNTINGNRRSNEVHLNDDDYDQDDTVKHLSNELDGKVAKGLKKNYERLHRLATNTQTREFEEPKVNGLWKLAQEADFNAEELESVRKELKHYEQRLQKMHHLTAELDMVDKRRGADGFEDIENETEYWEKTDVRKRMDSKLKKHRETVDKLHISLADRIANRHSEL